MKDVRWVLAEWVTTTLVGTRSGGGSGPRDPSVAAPAPPARASPLLHGEDGRAGVLQFASEAAECLKQSVGQVIVIKHCGEEKKGISRKHANTGGAPSSDDPPRR